MDHPVRLAFAIDPRPDPEAVSMLCSMGFAQSHVHAALKSCASQIAKLKLPDSIKDSIDSIRPFVW